MIPLFKSLTVCCCVLLSYTAVVNGNVIPDDSETNPTKQKKTPPPTHTPPPLLRILSIGDDLTVGGDFAGGYRGYVYNGLRDEGYNVEMLGTQSTNPLSDIDLKHEGWDGKDIDFFQSLITPILNTQKDPDVILLHVGSMEFIAMSNYLRMSTQSKISAVTRYELLIKTICDHSPYAHIIATNLLRNANSDVDMDQRALFNTHVKDRIGSVKEDNPSCKVSYLNLRGAMLNFPVQQNLHLSNNAGYEVMGSAWNDAIKKVTSPLGDDFAPVVVSVRQASSSMENIVVKFSKPMAEESVNSPENFVVKDDNNNNVPVTAAILDSEKREIELTTDGFGHLVGTELTVGIVGNSIRDRTLQKKSVPPSQSRSGSFEVVNSVAATSSPNIVPSPTSLSNPPTRSPKQTPPPTKQDCDGLDKDQCDGKIGCAFSHNEETVCIGKKTKFNKKCRKIKYRIPCQEKVNKKNGESICKTGTCYK